MGTLLRHQLRRPRSSPDTGKPLVLQLLRTHTGADIAHLGYNDAPVRNCLHSTTNTKPQSQSEINPDVTSLRSSVLKLPIPRPATGVCRAQSVPRSP